jgi:ATP-binding cassette subfamily B protein
MYIQMLTFPVSAIGWTASMVQRAATSQRRINEFLETAPTIQDEADAKDLRLRGHIELRDVTLTYPQTGITAIKNINLKIAAGQKIAIVGRTGCGKTTLAQLLVRMFDPSRGSIIMDGNPLQKIRLQSLRKQISYVPQDVFLFSDTVSNNISFGSPGTDQEAIQHAAEQACILREIETLPEGFETIVGERGVTLSGGQKQRISIARALLKNPGILIFDDCLSAVDSRTEKEITYRLKEYLSGKTAIIITHRIMPGFGFDRILVMEEGEIVEDGTHEELLRLNGLYADLFSSQQARDQGGQTS